MPEPGTLPVVRLPTTGKNGFPVTPYGVQEMEILLACGRLRLEEKDVRRIRSLLTKQPDWNRLVVLTVFHRLTAFVAQNLTAAAADLVPEQSLEFLRARFIQDGTTALRQTADLLEILGLLSQADIFAIPYKGPVLGARIYGNLAFRQCMDLDVLIRPEDVPAARDLLERAGFVPRHPTTPAAREFIQRHRHSEIFTRTPSPILELHWAFAKQRGMFALGVEELRPRLSTMTVGGAPVPVLGNEDLLLVLCVHGANHLWSRLEWLCCVAELLRGHSIAWTETMDRAVDLHVEKYVLLGIILARDLLGAPVPEQILERARGDRNVVGLARIVGQKLAATDVENPETLNSIPRDLFRMRLLSTTSDRVKYLVHRLTTPSREDTRLMLPLGRRKVPLPALVRPFHVIGVLISGMFRQSHSTRKP